MPQCIFCDRELNAETKPEHVLLSALGGRMTTTRVDCSHCNGQFGDCRAVQGADGRMVAIHPGKRAVQDANGRMRTK